MYTTYKMYQSKLQLLQIFTIQWVLDSQTTFSNKPYMFSGSQKITFGTTQHRA